MKLLIFSDGHIGEYPEGLIDAESGLNSRLLDTLKVWDWIRELAIKEKVDAVIFGGDRFKPHRPPLWMRDVADQKVREMKEAGLKVALLLGNHDLYDKAGRWNSYGGINVWNDDSKIVVFDTPGAIELNGTLLYFLPYGFNEINYSELRQDGRNILFFHDEVQGLSNYGHFTSTKGISPSVVDREEFRLVLGGHVHLHQRLKLQNTVGYHIGTPLERLEDSGQGDKGALLVDVEENKVHTKFILSPSPKIIFLKSYLEDTIDEDKILASYDLLGEIKGNVVFLDIQAENKPSPTFRKKAIAYLKEKGASSAQVQICLQRSTYAFEEGDKVVLPNSNTSIPNQVLDWAFKVGESEEQIAYLQKVLQK